MFKQRDSQFEFNSKEINQCKADNRFKVITTHKDQLNKLFNLREQISSIGSPRGFSEHVPSTTFGRKLDSKLPQKELSEIANFFDKQRSEQVRMLSQNYVNEMVRLSQCIEKKLRK